MKRRLIIGFLSLFVLGLAWADLVNTAYVGFRDGTGAVFNLPSNTVTVVVTNTLPPPDPDLTGINGRTYGMNDQIELNYTATHTGFNWQLTSSPAGAGGGSINSLMGPRLGISGAAANAGSSGVIGTLEAATPVSRFGVGPGDYTLQVQAISGSQVSGWSSAHISIVASGLSGVKVYPNPCRSDKTCSGVTFNGLPANATVKIFTTSGHLVREIDGSGQLTWDLKNKSGETVASGLFLYMVTDGQGNKTRGKVAVIR
jgi:hypothetical protein